MYTQNSNMMVEQKNKDMKNINILTVKPRVDILESETSVMVLLEMPNVSKEDLQLKMENGLLHISGKRILKNDSAEFILRETRDVVYERVFELEKSLDIDKVDAKYEAGILSVKIEKKEKALPRVIEIN